jgi:DNA-binding CsgD family transcriptional regulator
MERLRDRDLHGIMSFLRDVHGQPDLDAFARHATEGISGVVGAQRVSYNEVHPRRGVVRAIISPACTLPLLTTQHYREHPMMQRFLTDGDGRPAKFSDFLTRAEFYETSMYQEHYRVVGVEHQMSVFLDRPAFPGIIGFALSRDRVDFSERDRLALTLLRPHLATAYDRSSAAGRLHAQMALLMRAADVAPAGVVLLSSAGRIEFITRRAWQWLREYFPRRGRPSSRLPGAVDDWLRRQAEWDAAGPVSPGSGLCPPPEPLRVSRRDRQLTIRAVGEPGARALFLEESRVGFAPGALAPLGLTPRESEVLTLVARGASNDAIARTIGARARTVAKHLERIHRKLGVESRAAAAARAHEVALSSTPPPH